MKMNKLVGSLLLSSLVISAGSSAFALTQKEIDEDLNKSNTMQVEIGTASEITPDPDTDNPKVDPPEKINGNIGIAQVSPLYFANVKLGGKLVTVPAQLYTRDKDTKITKAYTDTLPADNSFPDTKDKLTDPIVPSIQVVDARGTAEGWNVTAKASELKAGAEVMKGAYLTYSKPNVKSTKDNNDVAIYPAGVNADQNVITGGDAIKILEAGDKQGMGTYYFRYSPAMFIVDGVTTDASPIN